MLRLMFFIVIATSPIYTVIRGFKGFYFSVGLAGGKMFELEGIFAFLPESTKRETTLFSSTSSGANNLV